MPGRTDPRKLDITEIIKENRSFANASDVIKDQQLLEAIEALSQQVDKYVVIYLELYRVLVKNLLHFFSVI